jgi:hypothetical protein
LATAPQFEVGKNRPLLGKVNGKFKNLFLGNEFVIYLLGCLATVFGPCRPPYLR